MTPWGTTSLCWLTPLVARTPARAERESRAVLEKAILIRIWYKCSKTSYYVKQARKSKIYFPKSRDCMLQIRRRSLRRIYIVPGDPRVCPPIGQVNGIYEFFWRCMCLGTLERMIRRYVRSVVKKRHEAPSGVYVGSDKVSLSDSINITDPISASRPRHSAT